MLRILLSQKKYAANELVRSETCGATNAATTHAGAASATIGSKLYAFRGKSADDCDVDGVYSLTVSAIDLTADYASKDFKWTHVRCETSDEVSTPPRARSGHTSTAMLSGAWLHLRPRPFLRLHCHLTMLRPNGQLPMVFPLRSRPN